MNRDRKLKSKSKPTCIDLFCGIGGLSIGLERAGLNVLGGVDCWEDAIATYAHNRPGHRCMLADLSVVKPCDIASHFDIQPGSIDVIAGGPPCQGFSTVGKRNDNDPRNRLWGHFRNIVAELQPRFLLIENVEGLIVSQGGKVRDAILQSFGEIGYDLECQLLRAADYGVPQLRKRTIFLGRRRGEKALLWPTPTVEEHLTVADAIFDLPKLLPGEVAERYTSAPTSEYQWARRKNVTHLTHHEAANHPPHLVKLLSHIPDGGNRKSIPARLQPKSGFHNSYARLASWKPAIAITSNMRKPSSARATHPKQHRGLTVREGLRLQSFDDDFVVLGSRTSQYLQVGNAVPPLFGEAIGRQIMQALMGSNAKKERKSLVRV